MSYAKKELSHEEQVKEMKRAVDNIIDNTKSNAVVGGFVVDFVMRGFEMLQLNEVMQHISEIYTPSVPCSNEEKSPLKRRLDSQKMTTGTAAPLFTLIDAAGDSVSLANITNKYKLIVFWASWCPHCEQLLPDLYQWYLNRDMDIEVIAVSIDDNQDDWRAFVKERGFNWINCNEPEKWDGKVATEYNLFGTPTMFLLDKGNRIISKALTFNDFLNATIQLSE
jgi:thiol-disulfide isomerase/thioredoxin